MTDNTPVITRLGILDAQVCVPREWTDEQVIAFFVAEAQDSTISSPAIRREGDRALAGAPERAQCSKRPHCVHIVLDY